MKSKNVIGIIVAMQEELEHLLLHIKNVQTHTLHHCTVIQGDLHNKRLYLLNAGIGKVNAAIATALLIKEYQPDLIINIGIAGSVAEYLKTGDVAVSDCSVYYDVDATVFGYQAGQIPRMPTHYQTDFSIEIDETKFSDFKVFLGIICTGDSFLTSRNPLTKIKEHFQNIVAIDMEAAAVAQTCYHFELPFLLIKGITDQVDANASEDSEKNVQTAMENALRVLLWLLR